MRNNTQTIFWNSRKTWRITWTIGAILLFASFVTKRHLLYIHFYLFAVGVVSLIYSFSKCAEINNQELKIFYGLFLNRKAISFKWDEIRSVGLSNIKKVDIWQAGDRVRVPVKEEYEIELLEIKLKAPLGKETISHISLHDKINFFIKELQFSVDGSKIFIKNPPDKGFKKLISEAAKYLPGQNQDIHESINIYNKIVDIALFIVLFLQFVFWLFFRAFIFSTPG
jgi:hypothetical protein